MILLAVVPLLANVRDPDPRGLFLALNILALALPCALARVRLVNASRWGRFMPLLILLPATSACASQTTAAGSLLRFWFNDRFVEYRAELRDASRMEGTAANVRGERWSWTATRLADQ